MTTSTAKQALLEAVADAIQNALTAVELQEIMDGPVWYGDAIRHSLESVEAAVAAYVEAAHA